MNDWPVSLLHKNTISSFHVPHVTYWLGCWEACVLRPECCCWTHKCFFPEGRLRQQWALPNTVIWVRPLLNLQWQWANNFYWHMKLFPKQPQTKTQRGVNTSEPKPCPVRVGVVVPPGLGTFGSLGMNLGKPADLNTLPLMDPPLPSGVKKTGSLIVMPDTRSLLKVRVQNQELSWSPESFPAGKLCWEQNQHPNMRSLVYPLLLQVGWEGEAERNPAQSLCLSPLGVFKGWFWDWRHKKVA